MKNHIFKIFVLGITLLLLSSKVEGNNLAALIKAGDAYMAKRNFAQAAIEYQKAYKLDSKNVCKRPYYIASNEQIYAII